MDTANPAKTALVPGNKAITIGTLAFLGGAALSLVLFEVGVVFMLGAIFTVVVDISDSLRR